MTQTTVQILIIPSNLGGLRLDVALQKMLPEHSRSRLQNWIKADLVKLDTIKTTAKTKVWGGEEVVIHVPESIEENAFKAEDIALDIVYEDEALLIVNKPAGLVVHPAAGNWSGTMLNALLYYLPALADVPRCGIVHRLDKDTSGLLAVAKTLEAQTSLVRQLQARTVKREYRAVVWGQLWRNGKVDQPIGRNTHNRKKMAVVRGGKPAGTHFEVLERFGLNTYVRCHLETGRTHQIRVHMQFLKLPLFGDPVYGIGNIIPHKLMTQPLKDAMSDFKRQALHAIKLGLIHPVTNAPIEWQIDLPEDMKLLLEAMRHEEPPEEPYELTFDEGDFNDNEADDDDWDDDDWDDDVEVIYAN